MGVLDGLLGGLVSGAGAAASSWMNWQSQKDTNAQNLALTRETWARDDSAYQRKAADLQAAGLNPILAAGGSGEGVSSPIQMKPPQMDTNVGNSIVQGAATGMNVAQTAADIRKTNADARSAEADADYKEWATYGAKGGSGPGDVVGGQRQMVASAEQGAKQADALISTFRADNAKAFADLDLAQRKASVGETEQRIANLKLVGELAAKNLDWYTVNQVQSLLSGLASTAKGVMGTMGGLGMLAVP